MKSRRSFVFTLGFSLLGAGALFAADPQQQNSPETKLRESLRSTMLQLRQAQTERDALQAAKDQSDAEKKELSEKLDALTKQAAADQDAAKKKEDDLSAKLLDQENQIAQFKEALEKWKASYHNAAELAQKKENERAKSAGEAILLQRRVDDQQRKNAEMFRIANEILSRYENFGLGTALTAREPFVGTTRVKLQNLVQDYSDKLAEQKTKPSASP